MYPTKQFYLVPPQAGLRRTLVRLQFYSSNSTG